jgi:hypothetical protein
MDVNWRTLPSRMKSLRIDPTFGVPVPWFVPWIRHENGHETAEFRAMDPDKWQQAVRHRLCWVCGEPLGKWLAFPVGPMCAITRTTAEPPCHRDCAEWSIVNCPFLSRPDMVRRTDGMEGQHLDVAGQMITRNPGVLCLWITREYEVWDDGKGKPLITVGKPETVTWWREGRAATREEIESSIAGGLPILLAAARRDGPFAVEQLQQQTAAVQHFLPQAIT